MPTGDTFACLCPPGYYGATCAIDIDDCSPNPCLNGGACADAVRGFTCTCASGFVGAQCERDRDDCVGAPCANGGTCIDRVDAFDCVCALGYAGATCTVNADDCDPNPCFNKGTCADAVDGFTCACASGFAGVQCERNIDDCVVAPCANGGTCIDRVEGFACLCASGFSGATCATNIDDCALAPCLNGSTCTDGINTYTCNCPAGFWGRLCAVAVPNLELTSTSPLANTVDLRAWSVPLSRTGGTAAAVWSIEPGGTNTAWLSIDATSGLLTGMPSAAERGPVSVTVRVHEPAFPENFAQKTFAFTVFALPPSAYDMGFEGACPNGWTLNGDWQCGVPSVVGPAAAFEGTRCLGTQLAGNYSDVQSFASATATSPPIDLPSTLPFELTFRMWVDTEGSTYDGANLLISVGASANFTSLTAVTPAYPLVVAGQPAWGGHQAALQWQSVRADLSAFIGQTIRVRFAFNSDASGVFPGVYIDDLHVVPR